MSTAIRHGHHFCGRIAMVNPAGLPGPEASLPEKSMFILEIT